MKKKNNKKINKDKLKKVSGGKNNKKIDASKIFHETGRIIANPLIYKDYDYFNEN